MKVETRNGTYVLHNVHDASLCSNWCCIVHNPIFPTPKRNLVYRDDLRMFEEICSCGIGHPCQEDAERLPDIELVHGCCGKEGHCFERYDS